MSHPYQENFYVFKFVFSGWGICLTLLENIKIFLHLVFGGEACASPLSNKSFSICVFGVRHMPHPSWKYSIFPSPCVWRWGMCFPLIKLNSKFLNLCFRGEYQPKTTTLTCVLVQVGFWGWYAITHSVNWRSWFSAHATIISLKFTLLFKGTQNISVNNTWEPCGYLTHPLSMLT